MIVDMMRNDLGRVADPGSVAVTELFAVERYDTVFQLTSTVAAESDEPPSRILSALFPAASVTGAPKRRTMELIAGLEGEPRGIYTGAIGTFAPGRRAQFSVAIRTAHVDRAGGRAEYGTGGGIVWDSRAASEQEECRAKSLVLVPRPRFELLETLLWRPGCGYSLLERHLQRLADSALYFGFQLEAREARRLLADAATQFGAGRRRVRLLASPEGTLRVESEPLPASRRRWRVALDRMPVDAADRFLFHKTTWRPAYDAARARFPSHDDVLLRNRRGELTESTLANLVLRLGGELLTPPVASGLLAGVARAELLARGRIREQTLRPGDLAHAEAIFLVNSVRGWVRAELDPAAGGNPRRRST
jgi:para-aminobenzoate synthetase/4-amino-4-deoxychorismate lyase